MTNIFTRIDERARGKAALADRHPETTTREHVMSVRSDSQMLAPYTYLDSLVTYETYIWVRKAVGLIADNIAPLPLYITRDKERLDTHPLLDLLTSVNDTMTSPELWKQWAVDLLLGGETGWELIKNKRGNHYVELWPRQPHTFNILPDPRGLRYRRVKAYEIDDRLGDPYTLPPDEFLHFKFYNPRNPWRGIGVLLALRMSVAVDVFAQAWEKYLFLNNARPDYAVVTPQGTTQTERDDIEKKIQQKYGGTARAGQVIALEEGITDIKILSYRPKDLGELELRKMSRDEVAGGFGVPDILMGFGNDSYDSKEKRTAAIQALYTLTLKPLLGFRDGNLTEWFQRQNVLAPNETVHTDYSGVQELQEEIDAEWARDQAKIQTGVTTINRWLSEHGQEPLPWGNVWWAPANLVPVLGAGQPALAAPVTPGKDLIAAPDWATAHLEGTELPDVLKIIEALANAVVAQQRDAQPPDIHVHLPAQPAPEVKVNITNDVQPAASVNQIDVYPAPAAPPVLIQNNVNGRPAELP